MDTINISVLAVVLLLCNVVIKISNAEEAYCYGDICNKATDNQFCSDYFKLCRNCADIVMDCGTEQQPPACIPYCTNYKAELKLQKIMASNCTVSSSVLNVTVNTTRDEYQQGHVIGIACDEGYEPHFTATAQCGEFGVFHFPSPTCEVKTCTLSPMVASAYITPKPDQNGRYPLNTTVTITCEETFTLIGVSSIQCLGDDKWTGKAPFCLSRTYTWWYNNGVGIVATCATLFMFLLILIAVILCLRRKPLKEKIQPPKVESESLAESGIDVNGYDEDETSHMMKSDEVQHIVIDEKDIQTNDSTNGEEENHPVGHADVIPSAPPHNVGNPEKIPSGVMNQNTNYTYNIYGNMVTNQTEHIKVEGDDDKNDNKSDRKPPEEENVKEKSPTEESQTTVVALQETEKGTGKVGKGAKPIFDNNDSDIALDNVPLCLKKQHIDDLK